MTKTPLWLTIAAFVVGGVLGGFVVDAFAPEPLDVTATEDSIHARQYQLDSIAIADVIRDRILDSINTLPTPDERLPERLRFVRSATRQQQLDSALTQPS